MLSLPLVCGGGKVHVGKKKCTAALALVRSGKRDRAETVVEVVCLGRCWIICLRRTTRSNG